MKPVTKGAAASLGLVAAAAIGVRIVGGIGSTPVKTVAAGCPFHIVLRDLDSKEREVTDHFALCPEWIDSEHKRYWFNQEDFRNLRMIYAPRSTAKEKK